MPKTKRVVGRLAGKKLGRYTKVKKRPSMKKRTFKKKRTYKKKMYKRKIVKKTSYKTKFRGFPLVHVCVERGEILTINAVNQLQYLGHHSTPTSLMYRALWLAAFHKLMEKASVVPRSADSQYAFSATTQIGVGYRRALINTGTPYDPQNYTQENWTPGAGNRTAEEFAIWAMASVRPWNSVTEITEFVRLVTADSSFNAAVRPNVEVDLMGMKIKYEAKSSLKIQNRSKTGASTEADVVDDVPLYGRLYRGYGTGPTHDDHTIATNFHADNTFGVIKQEGKSGLLEPGTPHQFKNVVAAGKIGLNAGQIKTSVITDTRTFDFNTLIQHIRGNSGAIYEGNFVTYTSASLLRFRTDYKLGRYELACLEKVMNVDSTQIVIAYECQHDIKVGAYEGRRRNMSMYFKSVPGTLSTA